MSFFNILKRKLIVLFLLIGLIPALIIGGLLYFNARDEIRDKTYENLSTHAGSAGKGLEEYFRNRERDARVLASKPIFYNSVFELNNADWNRNHPEWESRIKIMDELAPIIIEEYDLNSFFITNNEGILIYDANPVVDIPLGLNLVEESDFFRKSIEGKPSWNDQNYSDISDSINLILSMPMFSEGQSGEVVGTLNMSMGQRDIDTLVHSGLDEIGETANAYLIDEDGILRSSTYSGEYSKEHVLDKSIDILPAEILSVPIDERNFDFNITERYMSYRDNEVLGHLEVIRLGDNPVGLVVEIDQSEIFFGIITLRNFVICILLVSVIVIIMFSYFISGSITKPIKNITNWARELADGNYSTKNVFDEFKELKDLSVAFNKMAEEIEDREDKLNNQKEELIASNQQLKAYSNEVTQLNKELEYQASHDYLTGLPNRRHFFKVLEEELDKGNKGAVILLDLDDFKEINDTLGHVYGDQLLEMVGDRLLSLSKKEKDIFVARYGGDEFLILAKNIGYIGIISQQLRKIEEMLNEPYKVNNGFVNIGYSMGVTFYPDDARNTYDLITYADTAMYQAKELMGKNKLYYNEKMIKRLKEKKKIKEILNNALENDNFNLKYQPVINLDTGKADCFEALIRLDNFEIFPDKFIPISEESNLIIKIGRWVTEKVIEQISIWKDRGYEPRPISINFSAKQLNDKGYIEFLQKKLNEYDLSPDMIEVEITERILLERTEKSIEFLKKLKKAGINIALDDFGTGYSSLSYLTYIDLDKIKLDSSLNKKFLQKEHLNTMNSLIALFNSLDLTVVAEGIENFDDFKKLKERGCDYIQGYLFSKPVSAMKIEELYNHDYISGFLNK